MAGFADVVKYGGLGLLAYWLYKNYGTSTTAATPAAEAAPAATPAVALAPAVVAPVVVTPAVAAPAAAPAVPVPSTLDAMFSLMTAGATASGASVSVGLTPDQWNWYLMQTSPQLGPAPDPLLVFPGVDRSQPMFAGVYWAAMAPYLRAHLGLSGLGHFGAVGALYRRRVA
jgi:hypothetical protein